MAHIKKTAAAAFASAIFAFPAAAFDQDDLDQLRETMECIWCDLSGADLFGEDLSRAVLSGADLTGADLAGAILYFAIVQGANLEGADLSRSDLYGADFYDSNFDGVTLKDARICHTVMPSGQRSYNQCGDFTHGY